MTFFMSCNKSQPPHSEKHYSKTLLEIDKYNTKDELLIGTPTHDRLMADSNIHTDNINRSKLWNVHRSSKFDTLSYQLTDSSLTVSHISFIVGYVGKAVVYKKTKDSILINERKLIIMDTIPSNEEPKAFSTKDVLLATYMETKTTLKLDPSDKNKVIVYEGKRLR